MAGVAVVIGAYNPGAYLREAVASVVAQTFEDWECIVVDDGGSEDLAWAHRVDARVRLLAHRENQGVSVARNTGVAATTAPMLAFLDADDLWHPDKLTVQLAEMRRRPEAPGCSTDFEIIDEHGAYLLPGYGDNYETHSELLVGCGVCLSTMMVRREAFAAAGGFDPRYRQVQDWALWLRLTASGAPLGRVNQVLTSYRMHSSNQSRSYQRLLREGSDLLAGYGSRAGVRRLRRLAGTQAFDAYRESRELAQLVDAFRLNPRFTSSGVAIGVGARAPGKELLSVRIRPLRRLSWPRSIRRRSLR